MKPKRARHYEEKYNQFSKKNTSQGITMRNIINSLIKTHRARNNNEKYNQFLYQKLLRKALQ